MKTFSLHDPNDINEIDLPRETTRRATCRRQVFHWGEIDQMTKITRFEDLKVWQLSHQLSLDVANLIRSFPKHEKYDLSSQMRRSARSLPSDISEGFGRFHFNDKLTFYERARASLGELRNHFKEALGNNYIDSICHDSYSKRMDEIGYLLNRMMSGVRRARDLHTARKDSSRRLTSSAKR